MLFITVNDQSPIMKVVGPLQELSEELLRIKAENTYLEKENDRLKEENDLLKVGYMSVQEVLEYTGFGLRWLNEREADIGYSQPGKEKRYLKADIDAYMAKHRIQRKQKR